MTAATARLSDLELLALVREGEHVHFGELWNRYQGWAHYVARSTTGRYDAEDIVQEAFTKVLSSLRNGNGPSAGFAHYLRTAIRSVAATWGCRDARATMVPFIEDSAVGSYEFDVTDLGELELPFRGLPPRWQHVLHLASLQGLPMAMVADAMGMTVGAATALAARARRGLRESLGATRGDFDIAA